MNDPSNLSDLAELEDDYGRLDRMPDDHVRERLESESTIAAILSDPDRLRVPPVIVARVLSGVIDKLRRSARAAEHSEPSPPPTNG